MPPSHLEERKDTTPPNFLVTEGYNMKLVGDKASEAHQASRLDSDSDPVFRGDKFCLC